MVALVFLVLLGASSVACYTSTVETWIGGFRMAVQVPVCLDSASYTMRFSFSQDIDLLDSSWLGQVTSGTRNNFVIYNSADYLLLHSGQTTEFVIVGRTGNRDPTGISLTSFSIDELSGCGGNSGSTGGDASNTNVDNSSGTSGTSSGGDATNTNVDNNSGTSGTSSGSKDYADALYKSILFYYAQRSGPLPANDNPFNWRGDSAVSDRPAGGWYDAGDNVKFTFTIAFAATTQLWSMYKFPGGYAKAGQLSRGQRSVKWGLDYLLNCWTPGSNPPSTGSLVAQIGDAYQDHATWVRPENMKGMDRTPIKLSSSNRGSNVAAETAAALALGSLVFRSTDSVYADRLLNAARQVFAFAEAYPGEYHTQGFYSSSGSRDELCVAAVWLKRATGQSTYLTRAKSFYDSAWFGWSYSWDDKKIACQVLLYEETKETQYKDKIQAFFNDWLYGGVTKTPCGLAWRDEWGSNRYAAGAAFVALVAAADGINSASYVEFAKKQIDYMLGDNPLCISYLIGYGSHFPREPHHRGASCYPVSGDICEKESSSPYPNVLTGALVGGPGKNDDYVDNRHDYVKNEVAIDYNSGFQGAVAGLLDLDWLPNTTSNCPCNIP